MSLLRHYISDSDTHHQKARFYADFLQEIY